MKNELYRKKHVSFFKRCLGILPEQYEDETSNMMAFVYFCLTGVDLLKELENAYTKNDINDFRRWIYSHAFETEAYFGFRGSVIYENTGLYDPPDLSATTFAILSLITLGDNLTNINRKKVMRYVIKCQREDGSFAQCLDMSLQKPFGESDTRICMLATMVRSLLKWDGTKGMDIDVNKLYEYVNSLKTYDGGFGMDKFGESHSGLTFCALCTLYFVNKLDSDNFSDTVDFLVHRQVCYNKYRARELSENEYADEDDNGGFNGRPNKYADTCYAFWCVGSLKLLGKEKLVDFSALQNFLLNQTQNDLLGGFTKTNMEEDTPDPVHSMLAIAALSIMKFSGLDGLNPGFVISEKAFNHWKSIKFDD